MTLNRSLVVLAAVLAVGGLVSTVPQLRRRAELLTAKISGQSGSSWSEVLIGLAPYRWEEQVRQAVGQAAPSWQASLEGSLQLGGERRKSRSIFSGPTPHLTNLDCHLTVLAAGAVPHPPHVHRDEELIVPLEGEVDIVRAPGAGWTGATSERAGFGRLVYHASRSPHTIRAVGPGPSSYLVLRWSGRAGDHVSPTTLAARIFDLRAQLDVQPPALEARGRNLVFEGRTHLLSRLHAHLSFARPGEGSQPHRDPHDVAIVVLEGAVATPDGPLAAPAVLFHPAGAKHAMRGRGAAPARYLALEFVEQIAE